MTITPLLLFKLAAFALSALIGAVAGKLFARGIRWLVYRPGRKRKLD